MYTQILKRVDPSLVIIVNRGQKLALIEACSEVDIPTILLQQGAIYNSHIGFSYPNVKKPPSFPDYVFTFGKFWDEMIEVPISNRDIRTVGWPYFESESQKYPIKNSGKIIMLSQPHVGDKLADFTAQLANNVNQQIIFKPHPNVGDLARKKYPQLAAEESISIVNDEPLYKLFSDSNTQIGYSSTALFEGIGFGLDTYIIKGSSAEHIKKLLETGVATLVETPSEICTKSQSEESPRRNKTELFFCSGSIENIKRELNEILGTK